MNNPSPLIPQGSLQEQKNKGRARVRIAVFVVLAIHGIGLLALLIVGCKKEPETSQNQAEQTNAVAASSPQFDSHNAAVTPTNDPTPPASAPSTVATSTPPAAASVPPAVTPSTAEQAASTVTPGATDYKIASGDNFSTLAKKFHVSSKAIADANPGVEPTKLKIGQTIHIPAPAPTAPAATVASATTSATDTAGGATYKVKSGDNLIKIASENKVSLKALRSANNLTTDRIKVGQVLKIPAKGPSSTASTSLSGTGLASATPTSTPAAYGH
jgi:LysM repeat protein